MREGIDLETAQESGCYATPSQMSKAALNSDPCVEAGNQVYVVCCSIYYSFRDYIVREIVKVE